MSFDRSLLQLKVPGKLFLVSNEFNKRPLDHIAHGSSYIQLWPEYIHQVETTRVCDVGINLHTKLVFCLLLSTDQSGELLQCIVGYYKFCLCKVH